MPFTILDSIVSDFKSQITSRFEGPTAKFWSN